jgi:hypothetical protein
MDETNVKGTHGYSQEYAEMHEFSTLRDLN